MEQVVNLLIRILVPLLKDLLIYQAGKSSGKKETELKVLEQQKKDLEVINELLEYEIETTKKYNSVSIDDIYDEWLSSPKK